MTRPRVLDLFCRRGGAGEGYRRAGFEVTGHDLVDGDYPPGEFVVADALERLRNHDYLDLFDLVHLSPPCQRYSNATADKDKHPDLVPVVQELLDEWGGAYIIENVPKAPLRDPVQVCGSAFPGLRVRRHRRFESNVPLVGTGCFHARQGTPVGVYGDHWDTREYFRPDGSRRGAKAHSLEEAQEAMGIDWMQWGDLKEAIPPQYTEFLGRQVLLYLDQKVAVSA